MELDSNSPTETERDAMVLDDCISKGRFLVCEKDSLGLVNQQEAFKTIISRKGRGKQLQAQVFYINALRKRRSSVVQHGREGC